MTERVLVTGAGGPAGYSLLELLSRSDRELFAVDIDTMAAGLYLVPPTRRHLVPRGDAPPFVDALVALCRAHRIDVLIPTVDCELVPIASATDRFERAGVKVVVAGVDSLRACLDKSATVRALDGVVPTPWTRVLDDSVDRRSIDLPCVAKPRHGSGGRGVEIVRTPDHLDALPGDGSLIVQQWLPGAEYSVDVLCGPDGGFVAAVPRERLKVDSGVAVAARTVKDPILVDIARRAATTLRIDYVCNVQLRRDEQDIPRILEINPRFPGTMPLTVRAGVDMPNLVVDAALGRPIPSTIAYAEIGMVRTLREHFVSVNEFVVEAAPKPRRWADLRPTL